MTTAVNEISVPDSKIAREITELVRDTEFSASLSSFEPRLPLGRPSGQA